MSVSYSSNQVTVGKYKNGTTTAASTTQLRVTSGDIVSGDIGRLVAVQPNASNSGETEVREITGVSGGTISISDPWTTEIPSGTTWVVAHTLQDVHDIGNAALEKVGDKTYRWDADWSISSGGFLGDMDVSLELRGDSTLCALASDSIVQFGLLRGGEGVGTETTGGCRLRFDVTSSNANVYSGDNSRDADGGVVNYYGCLIHSEPAGTAWMFQRMRGPTRFIGCNFDGPMGGRFYHEASEWVQCRMTGNNDATPAWSIGATFDRDIEDVLFYYNLMAMKSFQDFGGTLRNVIFTNNTDIFNAGDASSSSVFNFIDCTEFGSSDLSGNKGVHNFYRSVVLKTTDASGSNLAGVVVRINDKDDTTQGSIETSDASGDVDEILARRYYRAHNSSTYNSYSPFRIRYRKFGYLYQSLNSAIADPIKQSTALVTNNAVTQSEAVAQAHTGITVTDHGGSPVSWQSKSWGITVTGNLTTNSSLTASDIEHYLHYHLAQDATFNGKASGLLWHNLAPIGKGETENGTYGSTTKGVRVVDEDGDPFPGFTRMQADDGTYYTPPVQVTLELTNVVVGSRWRIEKTSDGSEIDSGTAAAATIQSFYTYTSDVPVKIIVRKSSSGTKYVPWDTNSTITSAGFSVYVSQTEDPIA